MKRSSSSSTFVLLSVVIVIVIAMGCVSINKLPFSSSRSSSSSAAAVVGTAYSSIGVGSLEDINTDITDIDIDSTITLDTNTDTDTDTITCNQSDLQVVSKINVPEAGDHLEFKIPTKFDDNPYHFVNNEINNWERHSLNGINKRIKITIKLYPTEIEEGYWYILVPFYLLKPNYDGGCIFDVNYMSNSLHLVGVSPDRYYFNHMMYDERAKYGHTPKITYIFDLSTSTRDCHDSIPHCVVTVSARNFLK